MKAYNQTPITDTEMKSSICFICMLLLLIGCQNHDKLTFEPVLIQSESNVNCTIQIKIPQAIDDTKLARVVNTALREEVISLLHFDEESEVSDINTAMASFESGFEILQQRYADETTPWEAKIDAEITFENASILSIALNAFLFTGGAHGYSSEHFLNFDKIEGHELENWQLFKNSEAFQHLAESKFRAQENIPPDKPINHTGFMFEEDSFYLPENIGFTEKGLTLLYNQYEISSFADGTLELVLPFEEIQKFMATETKL